MPSNVFSDLSLARRLERAEATANARFVEAHALVDPGAGFQWIEVAGAYAMYDGPLSPSTQTFGLGLFRMPATVDWEQIESFFQDRGAPVFNEVSPLADKALLEVLGARGYRPMELTTVQFLTLSRRVSTAGRANMTIQVRLVEGQEQHELWARTAAEGWREVTALADSMPDLLRVAGSAEGSFSFLAELDGRPIAAGSLAIHDGVALLAGASTMPEWRHRGAQRALLEARLSYAARAGCDLAMICGEPGSASQRNAEREGFRIAYTRIKWRLIGPRPA